MSDEYCERKKFSMKPNHYVLRDGSQSSESDSLPLRAVLRQLVLHGLLTALLLAAAVAMGW